MKKLIALFFLSLYFYGCSGSNMLRDWRDQPKPDLKGVKNWVQYYGPYGQPTVVDQINQFDMAVIGWYDSRFKIPSEPIVVYYLAAMELSEAHRAHHPWFVGYGDFSQYRIMSNPHYAGTWIMDVRKAGWRDHLLDIAIPATLDQAKSADHRQGVGLLLDTFGDIDLFNLNEQAYLWGAEDLIRSIHERYPNVPIILNEPPVELVEMVHQYIAGVVLEQFMADMHTGELFTQPRSDWGSAKLQRLIQLHDSLPQDQRFSIFTIYMVKDNDPGKLEFCIAKSKQYGFVPTVTPFSDLGGRYQAVPSGYKSILSKYP
ncbi:MAG: hypothetical protein NUV82_00305 [Candidatus Komeilibacteria bacterium]|nr:hypothetical protein [Candidatus Komeilibacteria bacterium]